MKTFTPKTGMEAVEMIPEGIQKPMTIWGIDCLKCGNTTPEEMICESCWSDEFAVAIYYFDDVYDEVLEKLYASRLPKEEGD